MPNLKYVLVKGGGFSVIFFRTAKSCAFKFGFQVEQKSDISVDFKVKLDIPFYSRWENCIVPVGFYEISKRFGVKNKISVLKNG